MIRAGLMLMGLTTALYSADGGQVHGVVVDGSHAVIPQAAIRAISSATGRTTAVADANREGTFHVEGLPPGEYLRRHAPGFREKRLNYIVVNDGRDVDLGSIELRLAGCDSPGLICDFVVSPPKQPKLLANGRLEVPLGCAVDFDKGRLACGAELSKSDLLLLSEGDHLYLEPRNGSLLAEPDSGDGSCRGAELKSDRVRVDSFGPGSDLCLRTRNRHYSHVFFTAVIEPDSRQITLEFVTRAKTRGRTPPLPALQ